MAATTKSNVGLVTPAERKEREERKQRKSAKPAMSVEQEYEITDVSKLKEHPQNPRVGNVLEIEVSIDRNGWYGVVTAQKSTGHILAGNHRYRAAKNHGAAKVPVVWVDVDDETALRILLADNRTSDIGGYDEEQLKEILDGLEDLEGTGYEAAIESATKAGPKAEVPDDAYTPSYAVMVVCKNEKEQEDTYVTLDGLFDTERLKVVAV